MTEKRPRRGGIVKQCLQTPSTADRAAPTFRGGGSVTSVSVALQQALTRRLGSTVEVADMLAKVLLRRSCRQMNASVTRWDTGADANAASSSFCFMLGGVLVSPWRRRGGAWPAPDRHKSRFALAAACCRPRSFGPAPRRVLCLGLVLGAHPWERWRSIIRIGTPTRRSWLRLGLGPGFVWRLVAAAWSIPISSRGS